MLRRLAVLAVGFAVVSPRRTPLLVRIPAAAPPSLRQLAKGLVAVGSPGAVVWVRTRRARGRRRRVREPAHQGANQRGTRLPRRKRHQDLRRDARPPARRRGCAAARRPTRPLVSEPSSERPGDHPPAAAQPHERGLQLHRRRTADRGDGSNPGAAWAPTAFVALATSHPPVFAPGRGWSYSNTGYILLGMVIEATAHARGRVARSDPRPARTRARACRRWPRFPRRSRAATCCVATVSCRRPAAGRRTSPAGTRPGRGRRAELSRTWQISAGSTRRCFGVSWCRPSDSAR